MGFPQTEHMQAWWLLPAQHGHEHFIPIFRIGQLDPALAVNEGGTQVDDDLASGATV